jgi:cytoskeleton protein RodZ
MTYPGDNATAPGAADAFSSVGPALRELRVQRGWSIVDVSARLKFAPRQIEALENEEWSELPRGSSLRGFLRNYARLLDIDPEPLLTAVEGPANATAPRVTDAVASSVAAVSSAVPMSASRRRSSIGQQRRRGAGVFGIVLVLIAAGAAYAVLQERLPEQWRISRMLRNDNGNAITPPATISGSPGTLSSNAPIASANQPEVRVPHPLEPAPASPGAAGTSGSGSSSGTSTTTTTTVIPPLSPTANTNTNTNLGSAAPAPGAITPPATTPAPTALVTPPASPAATPATAPRAAAPAGSSTLVLRVVNDSWVELKATNGTLVSKVLPAGSEHSFDVVPPGRLVVGNAGGATVSWQGKPMDLRSAQRDNVARVTLQ